MSALSPLSRNDLPADFPADAVDESFELANGLTSPAGRTLVLRVGGQWQVWTRADLFAPFVQVTLAPGAQISLRSENWHTDFLIPAADGQLYAVECPSFEADRAQSLFGGSAPQAQAPASDSPAPELALAPASPAAAASANAADDATVRQLAAEIKGLVNAGQVKEALQLLRNRDDLSREQLKQLLKLTRDHGEAKGHRQQPAKPQAKGNAFLGWVVIGSVIYALVQFFRHC